MSEELNPNLTDADQDQAPPDDFEEYKAWREAQETPADEETEEETSDAPAEPAAAESADDPDTSGDELDDEDVDTDGEPEPKRKGGFQKRIDRLTREKRELEARLAAAEGKPKEEAPKEEAPKPEAKGKPKVEDFDSYDEFTEALTEWKLAERDRAAAADRERAQAEEAHKAVLNTWNERAAQVKKTNPDYDKALDAASDVPIPGYVQAALLESERGPEVAYYLAKNRKELERIVGLSAVSAGREIGKIEARLATRPAATKPAISKAPKPVTPVQGSSAGAAPNIHDDALAGDYNAWKARRSAELKRK